MIRPVVATVICSGSRAKRSAALPDIARSMRIALDRIRFIGWNYTPLVGEQTNQRPFLTSLYSGVRQALQRLAGNAIDGPLVHRNGAEILVEVGCRLVPVENGPFEPPALPLAGDPGQFHKQGPTVSFDAHFRNDEQIFEVQSGPPKKRREIMEKQGKADWPFARIAE